jgi:hypothetical protein
MSEESHGCEQYEDAEFWEVAKEPHPNPFTQHIEELEDSLKADMKSFGARDWDRDSDWIEI